MEGVKRSDKNLASEDQREETASEKKESKDIDVADEKDRPSKTDIVCQNGEQSAMTKPRKKMKNKPKKKTFTALVNGKFTRALSEDQSWESIQSNFV